MGYTKAHSPINWENSPSIATPLNEDNLNKMDSTIGILDDRIVMLESTKATKTEISTLFKSVILDSVTGIITFTRYNGATVTIDTKLEKLAINFSYDATNEQLVITLDDGTKQYVDMSALVRLQEFVDSDTIAFTVTENKVTATIKNNSITDEMLESGYLGKLTAQADRAEKEADRAEDNYLASKSYAVGGTGTRDDEDTDNSKYYSEVAEGLVEQANAAIEEANKTLEEVGKKVTDTVFRVNLETGKLEYDSPNYIFTVNHATGKLEWEVA